MTRLLSIFLILPLAASFADVIKLKSGETIEGHVTASTADTVTIAVNFTPTIVDERSVARADIAYINVEAGDEIAYAKIRDIQSPDTELSPADCQKIIDEKLTPFLKQFPGSARAEDVRRMIAILQADVAQLKAGNVKISGTWYDKAAFDSEKYQIRAATVLEAMKEQFDAKNYIAAVNNFDLLQRTYSNSMAYVEGFKLGVTAIGKLSDQLDYLIANLPQAKAQRQAVIDRTPVEERQPIQQAVAAEDARAAAVALLAQKNQQHFFTAYPFDEKGLKAMQISLQQLSKQTDAVDAAQFAQDARLVRQANKELSLHELAAADTTLAELKTSWPHYEGLPRLEQRLRVSREADLASAAKAAKADAPRPKP